MKIWDGKGTGNTVPPVSKRKNFQVLWLNSRLLFNTRQKIQFYRVNFSFWQE